MTLLRQLYFALSCSIVILLTIQNQLVVEAGQGCPFDDGSCQEYCNQQGCNMGYCGHFAWIQCICRKCGDEWSWYDKVRYNPDKAVNQTELDSLKLNNTNPLILISNRVATETSNVEQISSADSSQTLKKLLTPTTNQPKQQQQQNNDNDKQSQEQQQPITSTLTTLLIPDLSDNGKLDLNDIPDENSEKFLDYLAKNHEKLVQATSAESQQQSKQQQQPSSTTDLSSDTTDSEEQDLQGDSSSLSTTTAISTTIDDDDDETIEIQISSSNNNQRQQNEQIGTTTSTTTTTILSSEPAVN